MHVMMFMTPPDFFGNRISFGRVGSSYFAGPFGGEVGVTFVRLGRVAEHSCSAPEGEIKEERYEEDDGGEEGGE